MAGFCGLGIHHAASRGTQQLEKPKSGPDSLLTAADLMLASIRGVRGCVLRSSSPSPHLMARQQGLQPVHLGLHLVLLLASSIAGPDDIILLLAGAEAVVPHRAPRVAALPGPGSAGRLLSAQARVQSTLVWMEAAGFIGMLWVSCKEMLGMQLCLHILHSFVKGSA